MPCNATRINRRIQSRSDANSSSATLSPHNDEPRLKRAVPTIGWATVSRQASEGVVGGRVLRYGGIVDVSVCESGPIKLSGDVIARRRAAKERRQASGASAATNAHRSQVRRRTTTAVAPILWVAVGALAMHGDRLWLPLSSSRGSPAGLFRSREACQKVLSPKRNVSVTIERCTDHQRRGAVTLVAERSTLFRALLNRENERYAAACGVGQRAGF